MSKQLMKRIMALPTDATPTIVRSDCNHIIEHCQVEQGEDSLEQKASSAKIQRVFHVTSG
jgi:hypothetical protein